MKKVLIATLMAAAGWLGAAGSAQAALLSIQPATAATTVGGTVQVDLVISGLDADNQIVSRVDLDIFYDPAMLQAVHVFTLFTPYGGQENVAVGYTLGFGRVSVVVASSASDATLKALQGDSFILTSIRFGGLANGFSLVNFGANQDERNVVGRNALSLSPTVQGACIAVGTGTCDQQVPEPAAMTLVGLGILGAGIARRRKQ